MRSKVLRLPPNKKGRDFVVGDIHGAFAALDAAMAVAGFDPRRDRLFSVGDLVDRGPDSARCVEFLEQPFFHAVRGNHEDELLRLHGGRGGLAGEALWLDGSEWWTRTPLDQRRRIVAALKRLPLAIEVATPRGTVGFVHAEVPLGMDWASFCVALEREDRFITETALWGRERIDSGDESGVHGIGRLFVGHNVQFDGITRYGNVYAVDTGAIFGELWGDAGLGLTMVNIGASTADLEQPRLVARLDVRGAEGATPSHPFGSHARR